MHKKLTQEQFLEAAKRKRPEYGYSKSVYDGAKKKVCVACPKHGDFWLAPDNLLRGEGCPKCSKFRNRPTTESFVAAAREKHPEYDYSEAVYTGAKTKMKIICPRHGPFWMNSWNFLNKGGCPRCSRLLGARLRAKTAEAFIKEAKEIFGEYYDYSKTEYTARSRGVIIGCPVHGDFQIAPCDHLAGCGCPKCREGSHAERIMQELLAESGVPFERNKKFDGLKDMKSLSYDFYLPEERILIELNGGQHYRYVPFYHASEHAFHRQKHHDWLKRKYARDHGLKLLVVPCQDFKRLGAFFKEFTAARG